ncbi:hypothetical protein XaC1_118 [Xanthomonas phage XaC1]|nr:hypothetical protein XaC1_118 [Xanthomonas phage XaC1]
MFIDDAKVEKWYITLGNGGEFLGYLPVYSADYTYYTIQNINQNCEFDRVSVVLGYENSDRLSLIEMSYYELLSKAEFKARKFRGSYEDFLAKRDEILDNIFRNPYFIVFVGCDDGDICMRFKDKEHALKYLTEQIVYFDEVYQDPNMMIYN